MIAPLISNRIRILHRNPSETRRTAFEEANTELAREVSRVWFVRLPDGAAVTNDLLQDNDHVDPDSGSFSRYNCLVEVNDTKISDLPTRGWRMYLHWELPVLEGWSSTGQKKVSKFSKADYDKKAAARKEQMKAIAGP